MSRTILLAITLLFPPTIAACASPAQTGSSEAPREVTVMCNSTVNNDTGACQVRANDACKHTARLKGVISSVEMTGKPTGRLYTITARYDCTEA